MLILSLVRLKSNQQWLEVGKFFGCVIITYSIPKKKYLNEFHKISLTIPRNLCLVPKLHFFFDKSNTKIIQICPVRKFYKYCFMMFCI